ncbi:bifunctional 3-(3-hydroxy-phenyl)propionate/3-hydroxycinnamic acid hydroxylase [Streptomyces antimycoticus]|uniref:3-(3-hydroxyphenyl)propionate hydroxylase n=1 Tax=Streptomyces antimycoticus TaxID=68175 RepID=A0A4D4K1N8_9ACTN|nr:bifunctional 3-(3-hydroxy-phenyl)propionate/3-hydroxycinnamic acid hydroxylase [Streptomyces antimycoticus]GDY40177.1 3-(3-hydroxyphenyl)propionate hydroxylase [Streptomyces antimycoticus]
MPEADVLIVGYGPIGQVLSILLATRGWRVLVVERWETPYTLPRATSFDGETARTLASLGVADSFAEIGLPADAYDWRNAEGRSLLRVELAERGVHGWPETTTMHQPALEAVLCARAERLPNLRVLRGYGATDLVDHGTGVELTATDTADRRLRCAASWVVGCDGANSFVRDHIGVRTTDLGFSFDWLLCDVVLHEPRVFSPLNVQHCDPDRPTTAVGSGPGRRRWEFMRLPGESVAELNRAETAWCLLKRFDVTPENATLQRHTVYSFQAAWADEWRRGRVLLAGDAAHLMPPFTGQGMCAGIRDVLNLSWKLDLVLRGAAGERLLDSYPRERVDHVREAIDTAVRLGRVLCVTDAATAASRDTSLLSGVSADTGRGRQQGAGPPLRTGLLYTGIGTAPVPPAGEVMPQGRVRHEGVTGLFDEVVGTGPVLLGAADPAAVLEESQLTFLTGLGTSLVHMVAGDAEVAPGAVVDVDEVYLPLLRAARARFLLVRPDHHIYGAARTSRELTALVGQFRSGLLE